MLIKTTGKAGDNFFITGLPQFPIYLMNGERPILFEGGISCAAGLYINHLKELLKDREPCILFLSHVHWDHCGAVSALKKAFPNMKTAASPEAAKILKRENAIKLIAKLNEEAFGNVMAEGLEPRPFEPFAIDIELFEGSFRVSEELEIRIISTPGHTRDHLSYYIIKDKILIAGEACGCLDTKGNKVIPEFLTDYKSYIFSMDRLAKLPAEILTQGHRIVFKGTETVKSFITQAKRDTRAFAEYVFSTAKRCGEDAEAVIGLIKKEQYDPLPFPKQVENSYIINLTVQVNLLLKAGRDNIMQI